MTLREKATIMNKDAIEKALLRIAHEILEKNGDMKDLAVVGIKKRGEYLAHRIAENIKNTAILSVMVPSIFPGKARFIFFPS